MKVSPASFTETSNYETIVYQLHKFLSLYSYYLSECLIESQRPPEKKVVENHLIFLLLQKPTHITYHSLLIFTISELIIKT